MNLIIFDCNGVLVDSEEISFLALEASLKNLEIDINSETIGERFRGAKLATIIQEIESLSAKKLPSSFEGEFRKEMQSRFERDLKPIPGVEEVLKNLNYPFCIASSGPLAKITQSLELTGLSKYFGKNIYSSYDINSWKPDPGIFLHAARQMDFASYKCIVIEDSIAGIQAANRAGMKVLAYSQGDRLSGLSKECATTFSSMNELPTLIYRLIS